MNVKSLANTQCIKTVKYVFKSSKQFIKANCPSILTGLGVVGVVTTTITAVKATPKAMEILDGEKYKKGSDLTVLETIRYAGPCYVPSMITGAATIGCILGANTVNLRRQAALASLYSASEVALKEYKEKAKTMLGPKKANSIDDEIVQDTINRHPVKDEEIFRTGHGDTLFYDTLSGRYFRSDIEFIRRVQNDINAMIIGDLCASLNDLYYQLDLDGIKLGEDCGWNVENMLDIKFTGALRSDGSPCVALGFNVGPIYNFRDM